jgi:hypothetical protein
MKYALFNFGVLPLTLVSMSCHEMLPVYVSPDHLLSLKITQAEQLDDRIAPPYHQAVRIVLTGENIYDDVFYDSVDIKGTMRIVWERKPSRIRDLVLTSANFADKELLHNGKMLLAPGQRFSVVTTWNLKSNDSIYLAGEMNFAFLRRRQCAFNIACSDPETFVVGASLNVYDRIGYVSATPKEFVFVGRECIEVCIGPVCPCIRSIDPGN